MTVKELIEQLEKFDVDMDVSIYVPGDDVGYWPEPDNPLKFDVCDYAESDEQFVRITIY